MIRSTENTLLGIKSLIGDFTQHLASENEGLEHSILLERFQRILEDICILKALADRELISWEEFKGKIKELEEDSRGNIHFSAVIKQIFVFLTKTDDFLSAMIEIPSTNSIWSHKSKILEIIEQTEEFTQNKDLFILGMINTAFKDIEKEKSQIQNPRLRGRRETGIYYTPRQWIEKLVSFVIQKYSTTLMDPLLDEEQQLRHLRIVDPACGTGDFLLLAYRHLNALSKNQYPIENIYGIDYDPKGLRLAQVNLYLEQLTKGEKKSNLQIENNFVIANALFLPFQANKGDFFQKIKGCDIIFMNPPWGIPISRSDANELKKYYDISLKNINSFEPFVRFAILLAKESGLIGAVLPKNFNKSETYTYLRQFILQTCRIILNVDIGKFPGVMQESILLVLQKAKDTTKTERMNNQIIVNNNNLIPQNFYSAMPFFSFNTSLSKGQFAVIQKMLLFPKLKDQLEISRGEEFGAVGRVLQCSSCKNWFPKKRLRIIECPHCKKKMPIESFGTKKIVSKAPQSTNFEEYLTGKDFEAYTIHSVHYLNCDLEGMSFKPKSFYTDKKLIIKRINSTLCATLEDQGRKVSCNVWMLRSKNYSLLYYLAIINSTLLRFWWEKVINHGAKLTTQISKRELNQLPIPYPKGTLAEELVELAQKLLTQPKNHKIYQKIDEKVFSVYNFSVNEKQTILEWKQFIN
ncbi:MAG: N-6 DNA methylase [Candidatus Hermodarchaeota archaeon]